MWYIYTVEYYLAISINITYSNLAIKKNKIVPFAATWMQLQIFILSEVRKRKTNTI